MRVYLVHEKQRRMHLVSILSWFFCCLQSIQIICVSSKKYIDNRCDRCVCVNATVPYKATSVCKEMHFYIVAVALNGEREREVEVNECMLVKCFQCFVVFK